MDTPENGITLAHDMEFSTELLAKSNPSENFPDLYSLNAEFCFPGRLPSEEYAKADERN